MKEAFDAFGNKITGTANQITQQMKDRADRVVGVANGYKCWTKRNSNLIEK